MAKAAGGGRGARGPGRGVRAGCGRGASGVRAGCGWPLAAQEASDTDEGLAPLHGRGHPALPACSGNVTPGGGRADSGRCEVTAPASDRPATN